MRNKYFERTDSLFDITEKYKEAIDLFVSIGFNIKDEALRKTLGRSISLEEALAVKKINVDTFMDGLIEVIESNSDNLLHVNKSTGTEIRIEGVLPCPVRVPLLEGFQNWLGDEPEIEKSLGYELKAASMGVDWIKNSLIDAKSDDVIADIFISAGFDLFFDKNLIGQFKSKNIFEDMTDMKPYNKDFENEKINLRDPDGEYSMIAVVPAVFLVNKDELGDRTMPSSWEDIMSEEFENKVSLPIGDFDLFNAILLNIYKHYGEEGVKRLGRSLLRSMHPSEMVKSHIKKAEKPIVTIMPYFFTKMTLRGGPMQAVWPKDGAIISPIFMLTKKAKKEKLKPIVDFFISKEVGEILSHNGRFPSVHPEVDNMIPEEQNYMWLGWDFIKENDIGNLIKKCEALFHEAVREV